MHPVTTCMDRISSPVSGRTSFAKLFGFSLVFCLSSIVTTSTSKMALVSINCPLVLVGLGQLVATLFVLLVMKQAPVTTFPALTLAELKRTFPLSAAYVLSLFLALEGIRSADFSVYVLLQWLTLLFVAAGQALVFSHYESLHVNVALVMTQLGTFITAIHYYSAGQYAGAVVVVLSNTVYAGYLLSASKTLWGDQMEPAKLLYCNTVVGICIVVLVAVAKGDLRAVFDYPHWANSNFVLVFSLSCACGAIAPLAALVLLRDTSPLTFAVVDGMKNLAVTYVGIFLASEFRFEMPLWRLYGTHVTVAGCLFYIYYRMYYSECTPNLDIVKVSGRQIINV